MSFRSVNYKDLVTEIQRAMGDDDDAWAGHEAGIKTRIRSETGKNNLPNFPFKSGGVINTGRLVPEMLITQLSRVAEHVIPIDTLTRIREMSCKDCQRDAIARLIVAPMCQITKAEDRVIPRLSGEDFDFPFRRYHATSPIRFGKIRGEDDLNIYEGGGATPVHLASYSWSDWIKLLQVRNSCAANMWKSHASACGDRKPHFDRLKQVATPGQNLASIYDHIETWIEDNDKGTKLCLLGGRNRLTVERVIWSNDRWLSLYRFCVNTLNEAYFLNVPRGREWHLSCGAADMAVAVKLTNAAALEKNFAADWTIGHGNSQWGGQRYARAHMPQVGDVHLGTDVRSKVGAGIRWRRTRYQAEVDVEQIVDIALDAMLKGHSTSGWRSAECPPPVDGYAFPPACDGCKLGWAPHPLELGGAGCAV